MAIPLSKRVNRLLAILVDESNRSRLGDRLQEEAANNIPFHDKSKTNDMDRIRFSILKLVSENPSTEDNAFELAKVDWRDLFMAAGFGYDAEEHERWYQRVTGDDNSEPERPWWRFW